MEPGASKMKWPITAGRCGTVVSSRGMAASSPAVLIRTPNTNSEMSGKSRSPISGMESVTAHSGRLYCDQEAKSTFAGTVRKARRSGDRGRGRCRCRCRVQGQLLLAESGFDLLHIQGATLAASGSASGFGAELPDNERY